jgi:hypothetical protein
MKKLIILAFAAVAFACGRNERDRDEAVVEDRERTESVERYSGENISPQLQDSADRYTVDTVSVMQSDREFDQNVERDDRSSSSFEAGEAPEERDDIRD